MIKQIISCTAVVVLTALLYAVGLKEMDRGQTRLTSAPDFGWKEKYTEAKNTEEYLQELWEQILFSSSDTSDILDHVVEERWEYLEIFGMEQSQKERLKSVLHAEDIHSWQTDMNEDNKPELVLYRWKENYRRVAGILFYMQDTNSFLFWEGTGYNDAEDFVFGGENSLLCIREERRPIPSFSYLHCGFTQDGRMEAYEKYTALYLFPEEGYTQKEWELILEKYGDIVEERGVGLHCFMTLHWGEEDVEQAIGAYPARKDFVSPDTFLEQYGEHMEERYGNFLQSYPRWHVLFGSGPWEVPEDVWWEGKYAAEAFTYLIWRKEWERKDGVYSLYYEKEGGIRELVIQYPEGSTERYRYGAGEFFGYGIPYYCGLVRVYGTEILGTPQDIYRRTSAEVLEALYQPYLEAEREEMGEAGQALLIGEEGSYLITRAEEMELLARVIARDGEIEPGIKAAESDYYVCANLSLEDWTKIGSDAFPFRGTIYGNGHTVNGFGFYVHTQDGYMDDGVVDLVVDSPLVLRKECPAVSAEEMEGSFGTQAGEILRTLEGEGNTLLLEQSKTLKSGAQACVISMQRGSQGGEDEIHVFLREAGKAERTQHFVFVCSGLNSSHYAYYLSEVDINYDGFEDLLLYEGYSGGTSRSHNLYHALVWDHTGGRYGEYEEFPSFPFRVFSVEFENRRLISLTDIGHDEQAVHIFELVGGEYRETETLRLLTETGNQYDGYEDEWVFRVLYYKMGQLIEERIFPADTELIREAYPHLDYWERG